MSNFPHIPGKGESWMGNWLNQVLSLCIPTTSCRTFSSKNTSNSDLCMIFNHCSTWYVRDCCVHISIKALVNYVPGTSHSFNIENNIFNIIINLRKFLWIAIINNNLIFCKSMFRGQSWKYNTENPSEYPTLLIVHMKNLKKMNMLLFESLAPFVSKRIFSLFVFL